MHFPKKGEHVSLAYTPKARHRINIGVSWDANEVIAAERKANPFAIIPPPPEDIQNRKLSSEDIVREEKEKTEEEELAELYDYQIEAKIGTIQDTFDMDLVCLIFDSEGILMDAVSPDPEESIDQSGKIYHSGDEQQGVSSGDDEVISVELRDLPSYAHCLVFLVTSQCGRDFSQILNPHIRVEDSYTHTDLLTVSFGGAQARNQTGFIFCSLYRGKDDWMLRNISEYRIDKDIQDWSQELRPFLN